MQVHPNKIADFLRDRRRRRPVGALMWLDSERHIVRIQKPGILLPSLHSYSQNFACVTTIIHGSGGVLATL